ncbi:MAG: phytoene/squalene synthase family protein [Chlorobiota bacterium]
MMESITKKSLAQYEKQKPVEEVKSNFLYSFSLLPKEEKAAINSLYAFCSYIDDIVDSTPSTSPEVIARKEKRLNWWEKEIEKLYNKEHKNILIAPLTDLFDKFNIPKQYFITLIKGCRRDLYQNRYQSFNELKDYCYSVASVVGLMSIEIFGYKYDSTKQYAVNLGYALQLTNILRDVKHDKDNGYIYLPIEDMEKFGYSEEDLMNEVYNENFIKLMEYQVQRAKKYYYEARAELMSEDKNSMLPAQVMDEIYFRLLEKIELNNYNVFKKKIKVSLVHKIMIAIKHWLNLKLFVNRFSNNKNL